MQAFFSEPLLESAHGFLQETKQRVVFFLRETRRPQCESSRWLGAVLDCWQRRHGGGPGAKPAAFPRSLRRGLAFPRLRRAELVCALRGGAGARTHAGTTPTSTTPFTFLLPSPSPIPSPEL